MIALIERLPAFAKACAEAESSFGVELMIDPGGECVAEMHQVSTLRRDSLGHVNVSNGRPALGRIQCRLLARQGEIEFGRFQAWFEDGKTDLMHQLGSLMAPFMTAEPGIVSTVHAESGHEIVKFMVGGEEHVMILRPGETLDLVVKQAGKPSQAKPAPGTPSPLPPPAQREPQQASAAAAATQAQPGGERPAAPPQRPKAEEPVGPSGKFPAGSTIDLFLSGNLDGQSALDEFTGKARFGGSHPNLLRKGRR